MTKTQGAFKRWLYAADPRARPDNLPDALRAARMGAVALGVQTVQAVISTVWMLSDPNTMFGPMRASAIKSYSDAGMEPEMAKAMADSLMQAMPITIGVFMAAGAVIWLVLTVVMWRKPNKTIPLIMLIITGASLVMWLSSLINPMVPQLDIPAWRQAWSGVSNLAEMVLFLASYRGAARLEQLRAT